MSAFLTSGEWAVYAIAIIRVCSLSYAVYVWFIVIGGLVRGLVIPNRLPANAASATAVFALSMGWLS